jgi:hypothetical protein
VCQEILIRAFWARSMLFFCGNIRI